jgi:catechol 2,3-dioxygenase-like lactoylglutathione lyase family enzyme
MAAGPSPGPDHSTLMAEPPSGQGPNQAGRATRDGVGGLVDGAPQVLTDAPTRVAEAATVAPMIAFSHCFMHVTDLEQTRAFYVDRLGVSVLEEGTGYLRLGGGGGFDIGVEERPASEVGARGIELELEVPDVDALVAALRAAGIAATEPSDQEWGARHAWLHDPDGYRISVWSPLE